MITNKINQNEVVKIINSKKILIKIKVKVKDKMIIVNKILSNLKQIQIIKTKKNIKIGEKTCLWHLLYNINNPMTI
jgi:hypothetical protein